MKCTFPSGTVVQYRDPHAEDRSYRVVFRWDEAAGTVEAKLSAVMPDDSPPKMETIRTQQLNDVSRLKTKRASVLEALFPQRAGRGMPGEIPTCRF